MYPFFSNATGFLEVCVLPAKVRDISNDVDARAIKHPPWVRVNNDDVAVSLLDVFFYCRENFNRIGPDRGVANCRRRLRERGLTEREGLERIGCAGLTV
jgi:hypothetical protein